MRRYSFLRCVAVCLGLALLLNVAPVAAATRTILVLGDSLSAAFGMEVRAGWPMLLQQRLQQQQFDYRVVNASISGDTTGSGLARLPALLEKHRPAIVIIALGGNDGLRGLPPPQIKHNIGATIAKARGGGAQVLLVGVPLPPNYGKRYTDRFSQIYREAAVEHNAPLVPFILEGVAVSGNRELMQADGIHPTAQAQPRMLENVWSQLKLLL